MIVRKIECLANIKAKYSILAVLKLNERIMARVELKQRIDEQAVLFTLWEPESMYLT
jgi:hypothetical protein